MLDTREYDRLKNIADDFALGFANNTLKFSNSSHLQQAKQKYGYALAEAEKLNDAEKIAAMKDAIYFFDTA
ncbi:MAG: hypothetical protein V4478_00245 [Patescibacteria group bacterium]